MGFSEIYRRGRRRNPGQRDKPNLLFTTPFIRLPAAVKPPIAKDTLLLYCYFKKGNKQNALMYELKKSQAQRQAETKRKILGAAVSCIDELGYHQTTIQGVAREAGLTAGAIRHYYPSKDELLSAVLRDGFRKLTFDVNKLDFSTLSVDKRIALFIDNCWNHCDSAEFQAILQILFGMRNESTNFEEWVDHTLGHFINSSISLWREILNDIGLDDDSHIDVLLFLFSALTGTALLGRINQKPARQSKDIEILKKLLVIWVLGKKNDAGRSIS